MRRSNRRSLLAVGLFLGVFASSVAACTQAKEDLVLPGTCATDPTLCFDAGVQIDAPSEVGVDAADASDADASDADAEAGDADASDADASDADAEAGDAGVAGRSATGLSAGTVAGASPGYRGIVTLGESPGGATPMISPGHHGTVGLVGKTQ